MTAARSVRSGACALVALVCAAAPANSQEPLVFGTGTSAASVPPVLHRGYPAFPATALRSVGGAVRAGAEGAHVILYGDTVVLHALSPFFTVDGALQHLAHPVYSEGGVVYLPRQFFTHWLVERYPERIQHIDGAIVPRAAASPAPGTTRAGPGAVLATNPVATPTSTANVPPAVSARRAPSERELARVVVIDAGHGGRDGGATGPGGVREKDVTLGIALRLAALLRGRPGYEVHLTRSTDTLVSLFDRPRLANRWKDGRAASLFVSIHANSSRDGSAHGFETFILSEARTADERAVAERENAAASYDRRDDVPDGDEVAFILSDLRNEFYVRASHDLASVVQNEIAGFHPGPNRGVKQAPFVVLVGAYMPAILVETAFVSNAAEARLLSSSSFQDRVALALSNAIAAYFDSHAYLTAGDEP